MSHRVLRLSFLLVLVAGLLLSACTAPVAAPASDAAGDASAAQATVRVMTFFAYDNPEVEQAVVDAFEAANPGINVELELTNYNDIFTKFQTQVAGGTAPDVISMNFENLRSFATRGAVEPLTDRIAADDFDTSIYYPNTLDMHTVDGTVYGLPATFSDNVLYYNKDMFDAAGIAYPDDTWDWAKLQEVGAQFVQDEDGDGVVDVYGYGPAWWPMYLFMWGSNILTADGSACALTSPEALEALNAYAGLFVDGGISANKAAEATQGNYDRFVAGKLAMFSAGPWAVRPFNDSITNFTWDIAHGPSGAVDGTFLYSNSYAIPADAENKDAAWEFIKFASGPEGVRVRQEGQFEIAAVQEVAESIFVESMQGQSPASPQVFMEATEYGFRLSEHARFPEMLDAVTAELDLALTGAKSMEEAMSAACTTIDGIIAEQ